MDVDIYNLRARFKKKWSLYFDQWKDQMTPAYEDGARDVLDCLTEITGVDFSNCYRYWEH